jgi:hypothetical protein
MFDTHLPTRTDQDLNTFLEQILEKYVLKFPVVKYRQLTHPEEEASGQITTDPSVSVVDDLWGEAVPPQLVSGFQQPHSDITINPTEGAIYNSEVDVNVKVEYETRNRNLLKYGRDVTQLTIFKFLNYQLLRQGITEVSPGDKFIWKDHLYKVNTYTLSGRWADTDYFLYSKAQASLDQFGS